MIGELAEGRGLMGLWERREPIKGKIIWNVNKEYRKKNRSTENTKYTRQEKKTPIA